MTFYLFATFSPSRTALVRPSFSVFRVLVMILLIAAVLFRGNGTRDSDSVFSFQRAVIMHIHII